MTGIFKGSTELLAGDLQVGSTVVQKVYLGSSQIWPGPDAYKIAILADSPISYFRLDDTSSSCVDETGNTTGSYLSTYTLEQPGLISFGSSVLFSGGRVSLASPGMTGTTYTLECWFQGSNVAGTYQALLHQSGVALYVNGSKLDFYFSGSHFNNTTLSNDTTYHVVLSVNAGAGTFYLNGVADGTVSGCPAINPASIGSHTTTGVEPFAGYIDEVAFYQTALTAQQALNHYNAGV